MLQAHGEKRIYFNFPSRYQTRTLFTQSTVLIMSTKLYQSHRLPTDTHGTWEYLYC